MFWWLKSLKYASQNNSNGEEKKKLINSNWFENFKNIFLIFHRNQRLQKA